MEGSHLSRGFDELDHVLVGFVLGIDTRFRTLHRKGEAIHDNDRVAIDFASHKTHDLVDASRSRVNDLVECSDGVLV